MFKPGEIVRIKSETKLTNSKVARALKREQSEQKTGEIVRVVNASAFVSFARCCGWFRLDEIELEEK